ncbi:hypothetical protein [Janthinobacterium tructae]|uniref:DUF4124 domain-containing protein n=1 Tax=Janthinobacterium tructae TaxID=2590869 RepID=A0A4Y6R8U9_9BURK|nr:hypothetical protein [Janthinobacterium tructae]QDG69391.1 hypothetical protein FJQ89_02405 [Janthinobacterium tructae]
MKVLIFVLGAMLAPVAHAETWQCTNAASGRVYTVSQAVPADSCKLVSSLKNPHFTGPAVSEQPVPVSMRRQQSCNKEAAQDVQFGIREFAKWHIEGDHLAVHWVYAIEKQPEAKRLQMVATYADMDACLGGAAREIMFYRKGKLMGIASPTSGLRLIK